MFSDPNRVLVEITLSVSENYPKVRKRESLLAQTLNNFMQINVKALGHRKKTVKWVVSSGAPRHVHKFLSWFEVDGRIIANLIRLLF